MKKAAFLLQFLLPLSLLAQLRQGAIVYERKIDVHRRIQDDQMKAMVPQFQVAAYEVLFKDSISVYKAMPKDEAPDPFENNSGGNHMVMKFGGPGDDGVLYKNYNSGQLLEEASLEDKKYIITDTLRQQPWKLSDDTATVLGHPCKKAMMTSPRGEKVIAWYSSDIPLPIGPEQFGGLPGAVLKVDVGDGGIVYTVKQIDATAHTGEVKIPAGGRLISRADYRKKMDEVLGPADAQGRRIIRN